MIDDPEIKGIDIGVKTYIRTIEAQNYLLVKELARLDPDCMNIEDEGVKNMVRMYLAYSDIEDEKFKKLVHK